MKISKEARIGISSIVIIFILYWGINFLKGSNILSSTNTFNTSYENVGGLEVSSPVIINGMKVGTVTKVDMGNINGDVEVEFSVSRKYKIPTDSEVKLSGQSLLGGKQLVIEAGQATTYLSDGSSVKSTIDSGIEAVASDVTDMATKLMDEFTVTLSKINSLMNDKMIEGVNSTVNNLNSATATLDNVLHKEKGDIEALLSGLALLTKEINSIVPTARKSLEGVESITDELAASLPKAISEVEALLKKLNSDEGVINSLATDKELYDNASETLLRAAELMEDMKNNPKKYVHFSLFGKKDKVE